MIGLKDGPGIPGFALPIPPFPAVPLAAESPPPPQDASPPAAPAPPPPPPTCAVDPA